LYSEVGCPGSLIAFFALDTHADVGHLYHAHVVPAIANGKDSFV
jgi:hypothetical protein